MEYQIELSPIQIQLNSEIYSFINRLLDINLDRIEIKRIKSSVEIIDVDKIKHLTTIRVNYESAPLKSCLLKKIDYFFFQNNLVTLLKEVYKPIIEFAQDLSKPIEICNFFSLYLKELLNTLLIDIYSDHFANMILYIIKTALRNDYHNAETDILANNILNNLLSFDPNDYLLNKYLNGQYWISSRHLVLVSNKWTKIPCNNQKPAPSENKILEWVKNNISEKILEKFELYLEFSKQLNDFKILDAQIQIRSAFLLKRCLSDYLKRKKNINNNDYIWDIHNCKQITQNMIKDCLKSIEGDKP